MSISKEYLLAFIIGSSLLSSFFSFIYIGLGFRRNNQPKVHYEMIPFGVLLMYGLFNMFNLYLQKNTTIHPRITAAISGALGGLTLSLGGRFLLDYPIKALNFTKGNINNVHWMAMIVYAIIFSVLVQSLNNLFL